MRKRAPAHVGLRNQDLFCSNCGANKKLDFPIGIELFGKELNAFNKLHEHCVKTWEPPMCDMSLTEGERIEWWLLNGETGISSRTMVEVCYRRVFLNFKRGHPIDPSDFRRCYLLVKAVPEIKTKFGRLSKLGKAWANVIEHWQELSDMLEAEMGKELIKSEMYDFMKKLGC